MTEYAQRFASIANQFTDRVDAVSTQAWNNPSPCQGWAARDIVAHLVEWIPGFFTNTAELTFPVGPSVERDPVGAWANLRDTLQGFLDDPAIALYEFDAPMGRMSVEQAIDMIVTGDVFLHTWDLARSVGLDETLDPIEVVRMFQGMEPMDEALRASGHYGPRLIVPDSADPQTKLLAFVGRDGTRNS